MPPFGRPQGVPLTKFPDVIRGFLGDSPGTPDNSPAPADVAVDVASLTFTGLEPSAIMAIAVPASTGVLTVTGQSPTAIQAISVAPNVGALALSGLAPSVTQALAVTAGASALTLTGQAPSAVQAISVVAGTGVVTLTGQAPVAAQAISVTIGAGALTVIGLAPSAIVQTNGVALGAGQLVIDGYAPDVLGAEPAVDLSVFGGFGRAPRFAEGRVDRVLTKTGSLTLTGYSPTIEHTREVDDDDAPWSLERDAAFSLTDDEAMLALMLVSV